MTRPDPARLALPGRPRGQVSATGTRALGRFLPAGCPAQLPGLRPRLLSHIAALVVLYIATGGPTSAAVYVPEPVPLYDALSGRTMTLVELGDEGLSPDRYTTPWKGTGPVRSPVIDFTAPEAPPATRVALPCRPHEYLANPIYCGPPAVSRSAQADLGKPAQPAPPPVPLPAAGWLLLAALAALSGLRRMA